MFCCITFNIILMQETFHGQASKSVPEKMSGIITVYVLLCTLPECFDKTDNQCLAKLYLTFGRKENNTNMYSSESGFRLYFSRARKV